MTAETTHRISDDANPSLRALDVLVGTWTIAGDAQGEAVFSWMEGGLSLQQRGATVQGGVDLTLSRSSAARSHSARRAPPTS